MAISLIHPDMFNRVLRKHGIAVEVTEREDGTLAANYETGSLDKIVSAFANQLLMYDMLVGMILDSNVGRLKDVVADLKNVEETTDWYDPEEEAEIRRDCIEDIESVIGNLDGVIHDYREETRR